MSKRVFSDALISAQPSKNLKTTPTFSPQTFKPSRVRCLTQNSEIRDEGKCVLYWMTRDQRVNDNYSLLCAQEIANLKGLPIKVVFNLVPTFLGATLRQYSFMINGLKEVEKTLNTKNVPFLLSMGDPIDTIPHIANSSQAVAIVTDFSPLRISRNWVTSISLKLDSNCLIPMYQVDAHNVVPCWIASPKLEYSARTIRSKIEKLLPDYLTPFPVFYGNIKRPEVDLWDSNDWDAAYASLQIDCSVGEVSWIQPGENAANEALTEFGNNRLKFYEKRNNPNENALSNLSPYFHFGQLSPQKAILYIKSLKKHLASTDAFVEEAVVRRELADNFCFYNSNYDSIEGCPAWAQETLRIHASDVRSVVYTRDQLEQAQTHDDLWNAAQLQMTTEGKMHGFLRMYWAKKILEWTTSPIEALSFAIYLNDKYQLDGRDPNGYVGCMWSIGGVHDQGWAERPIFGKIRYMNYEGCKRKFDVAKFVSKYVKKSSKSLFAKVK